MKARRRSRRWLRAVLALVVLGLLLAVATVPGRAVLAQRAEIDAATARLDERRLANAVLEARIAALATDAEIERLARERYGLIAPGEQPYLVLPPGRGADTWAWDDLRDLVGRPDRP